MGLADYLCETAICTHMECERRDDAVQVLLGQFVAGKAMPHELVGTALEAILQRERLGSTAIGKGVAVPHARLAELKQTLVGFGYSDRGVEFNALDGEPVHQIFLVIAPKEGADEYLGVMQRITRLVQNDDFRRFVAHADTREAVVDLIKEMDE